ncbi:glucose import [Tritrichomonas musculus]|uniref:Glucose import n=1 Tax=Tritrichomonas musculus TaxID=1915356 RepID=A0ABR2HC76_9EUKA
MVNFSRIGFNRLHIDGTWDKYNWSPYLPLASIFIYNIGFGFGLISIPWIIAFHLFSPEVRETGNALCVVSNWCFAFLIVMISPSIKASIGLFGAMIIFAVDCAVAAVYGLVFIKNVDTNNEGAEVSNLDESDNLPD